MPADASPTTRSPGYIADFKPIEDDPYKDFEMDPIDYPSDEEKESSGKEEEPLAPIDFASPVPSSAPLFEETEPFEIDDTTTTPPPHGTESYFMTALEEVMESLTDIAIRHMQDSEEFHTHHQDLQDDRVVLRARISTLARERRYYRHIVLVVDREAIIHDGLRPT
nr:hypothetical protein [Tanacetum cinerariifolium]